MATEILNKNLHENLHNLLLNVDAGTAYEDFSRSIVEVINDKGYNLEDTAPMDFGPIDNGELEIYTFIGGEKYSLVIPAGAWEIGKQ